jgi:hypothetical protein
MNTLRSFALLALVGGILMVACSSSDSGTPAAATGGSGGAATGGAGGAATGGTAGGATGGTAGGATGGTAGGATGGTAGAATGGTAGASTGGTAGGATGGAAGGGPDGGACVKGPDCNNCCSLIDTAAADQLAVAAAACACGTAGKCPTQCASTMCGTPPGQPDQPCMDCVNQSCMTDILASCTTTGCQQVLACMAGCK